MNYWDFHKLFMQIHQFSLPGHEESYNCMCVCVCICVCSQSYLTLCNTMDCRPPVSSINGISRQAYQNGLSFSTPGDLSDPGIESHLLHLLRWQVDSLPLCHLGSPIVCFCCCEVASVMSNFVQPHRWQPTRLPHRDSLGKNTGVGCHFLLQCMKLKSESEVIQSCLTLSDPMDCSLPGSSLSMGFSRQEYWSGVPLPSPPNSLYITN